MISSIIYLFKELVASLSNRSFTRFFLSVGFVFVFLSLLVFYQLLGSNPNYVKKTEILAVLKRNTSESTVNELYRTIRDWDEVAHLSFVFQEEANADLKAVPDKLDSDYFRIGIENPQDMDTVTDKLRDLDEVKDIISYNEGFIKKVLTLNFSMKIGAWVLLVISLILTFIFLRSFLKSSIRGWEAELEAMYLSGIRRNRTYFPFLILTTLAGILAAVLTVLLLYLFHNWALGNPQQAGTILPAVLNSGLVLQLSLLTFLYGILIGLLGGMFSIPIIKNLDYI